MKGTVEERYELCYRALIFVDEYGHTRAQYQPDPPVYTDREHRLFNEKFSVKMVDPYAEIIMIDKQRVLDDVTGVDGFSFKRMEGRHLLQIGEYTVPPLKVDMSGSPYIDPKTFEEKK